MAMIHSHIGSSDPNIVHLTDIAPRGKLFTRFEKHRHDKAHWFSECFAEFMGVFLYVYAGVGSTAPWVIGNALGEVGFSSVFQIGAAYATGIVFALGICGSTSGGHFNPGVTVALVLFKEFPLRRGIRYIFAQLLGGYVACLLIYCQYKHWLDLADAAMKAAGTYDMLKYTPEGTAGIFALYRMPGADLGQIFLNEFITDTAIAIVIWGSVDPTNILIPPASAPFVIALAYASSVWGFALNGLAANAARDVGGRLAALTIYGNGAGGGSFAAIAACTNIPATIFGAMLYELFLADSQRVVSKAHVEYLQAHRSHGCLHEHPSATLARPGYYERNMRLCQVCKEKPEYRMVEQA